MEGARCEEAPQNPSECNQPERSGMGGIRAQREREIERERAPSEGLEGVVAKEIELGRTKHSRDCGGEASKGARFSFYRRRR